MKSAPTHGRKYGDRNSYPIPVWNGVFEHHSRIGESLWEFLWCIDAITSEKNGVGLVHGGAPVKIERIANDLKGADKETVRRHLRKLVEAGYIGMRRTPYGQVIEVLNSKKFDIWKGKEKPQNTVSPPQEKPQRTVSQPGEKPTDVDEKPQITVNKEDSAVTQQGKAVTQQSVCIGFDFIRPEAETTSSLSFKPDDDDVSAAKILIQPNGNGHGNPKTKSPVEREPKQDRIERYKLEAGVAIARRYLEENPETIKAVMETIHTRKKQAGGPIHGPEFFIESFHNEAELHAAKGIPLSTHIDTVKVQQILEERMNRSQA